MRKQKGQPFCLPCGLLQFAEFVAACEEAQDDAAVVCAGKVSEVGVGVADAAVRYLGGFLHFAVVAVRLEYRFEELEFALRKIGEGA